MARTMSVEKFVTDMLRAGCRFDPSDERKLLIPEAVAERAGVLPGYFYIYEPVDGIMRVEKFSPDGTQQHIQ
jgi:hypothetical protein